jgi:hypothetical protein
VRARRRQTYVLFGTVASTVTAFILSAVFGDVVKTKLLALGRFGLLLIAVAALVWLWVSVPVWRRQARERRARSREGVVAQRVPRALANDAGEAERWLLGLGSDTSAMAATSWFESAEPRLRKHLRDHGANPAAADALARICDALDAWYVRQRRHGDLLDLAEQLATLAEHAGRRDLKEVAAARAATGHRLAGDLDAATRELGRSAELAARGPTAAAIKARREVEWALSNLARADRSAPGADQEEHLMCAQDRLADAAAALPSADLAGDTAIHLNLGLLALYRDEPALARKHLGMASARAVAARDTGAQAHSAELDGVAAWAVHNPAAAVGYWRFAMRLYADLGDRESQARCLQHLGSAALRNPKAARELRRDGEPVDAVPLRLLEASAGLRAGTRGHDVLHYYLAEATRGAEPRGITPPPPSPEPTPGWLGRLRRVLRRLTESQP